MAIIKVSGIKLYAWHGCLDEEGIIGGNYVVDVVVTADIKDAVKSDDLTKTADYSEIYQIVKQQMAIRSRLVEHVTQRIVDELLKQIKRIETAEVTLTKINPPMNGDVESASVTIIANRK